MEDDEGEEGEGAMLKRLENLSKYQRYRMAGKMFILVIWAWSSSNW